MSKVPSLSLVNAIHRPSGETRACASLNPDPSTLMGSEPPAGSAHIVDFAWGASLSNSTNRPSAVDPVTNFDSGELNNSSSSPAPRAGLRYRSYRRVRFEAQTIRFEV